MIENGLSYRLHYVSTALLGRMYGPTEKAIPRPAYAFGDAGKNKKSNVEAQVTFSLIYIKKK